MSTATTTLKLPAPLKARIAPLAEAAGKTPHAWMVDALEAQAALAEMREAFIAEGEAAAADIDAGGPLYAAEDVHAYIVARAAGKPARRPRPARRAARTQAR
jgi:predicted transcriptional regulator